MAVPPNQGIFCLVCQITTAIMKSHNTIKCHYSTKHASQFGKIVSQARVDKIEHLKKSIKKQQGVFTSSRKIQNWWQNRVLSFVNV